MARRGKQNSDDLFIALLMSLPWWVPFVLAAALTVLAALATTLALRAAALAAFMWACIFVLIGIAIPFLKQRRKEILTGASDLPAIRQMNWQRFEVLVGEAFRRQGYVVVEAGGSKPDGGVDLVLHKRSEKIIVQCKHWQTQPVGVAFIRELRGVVAREKAKRGIFVTSSSYTSEALAEAKGQPLELIDGAELLRLIHSVQLEVNNSPQEALTVYSQVSEAVPVSKMPTINEVSEPLCPKCGSSMKIMMARNGPTAGNEFWGCSRYPNCKGSRSI